MAKDSRFQYKYRKNASKLHKAVGEILRTHKAFRLHEIYQEYPVNKINKKYENGSHHFDWVIPQLKIIIECHGKQHYEAVAFDGNMDNAVSNFKDLKARDSAKKKAALDAGFIYIEVPYTMEKDLTGEKILDLYQLGKEELARYNIENREREEAKEDKRDLAEILKENKKQRDKELRAEYISSKRHLEDLRRQREFRQKKYRELKEKRKV